VSKVELSIDYSWIAIILGITSCLVGFIVVNSRLYVPINRVIFLERQIMKHTLRTSQLVSQFHQSLGYIRRKQPTRKVKHKIVSQAEEAPVYPLFINQSNKQIREDYLCIHGFIQSYRSCNPCSPSFSVLRMTGV
jgi:hypothetical protein